LIFAESNVTFYVSFVPRVSGAGTVGEDVGINDKEKDRSQPIGSLADPYVTAENFSSEENVIFIV
jgi:hypothetical protein